MSTLPNTKTNTSTMARANAFIAAVVMCAAALVADSVLQKNSWHVWEFLSLLFVATLTARLKVKLPGVNSNMSVSLPFLLIASTRLSLPEMLLTATCSLLAQSVPKAPHKFNPLHALFNVSTGVLATGLAWEAFHRASAVHAHPTACLLLGCVAYVITSTIPVAGIISLTEHQGAFHTWSEIMHLSFPYYVASTGLASIALSLQGRTTLPLLVGVGLVSVVMYHSYRRYFAVANSSHATEPLKSRSAAAGA